MKCAVIPGAPRVAMCGCRRSSRGSVRLSLLRNSLLSPLREWIKEVVGPRGGVKAEIAGGATGSFFLKAVGMLLRFGVGVVLARLLGADGYGIYAYAMALVGLMQVPVQLGLPNLLVRALWLLRRIPEGVRRSGPEYETWVWARKALSFVALAGIGVINQRIDIV